MGLPWFRVHICILNDPGRLISVHIMHNGFVVGWSGVMLLYELIIQDPSDPVLNPIWRQGCYVIPFVSRLGVIRSFYSWSLGIKLESGYFWTYETISEAHILLSGLFILAAFWHWSYWDLDVFVNVVSGNFVLDLNQIIGLHLDLAAMICFGFGLAHLSGFFGPGFWTSDSFGVVGSIRFVKPIYSLIGLSPFCYGVVSSNHIGAGFFGIFLGLWHISTRPGPLLYKLLNMGNVENILSSSISSVFFSAFVISGLMWYGCVSAGLELFGPSRYHWDNGYFSIDIERRVNNIINKSFDFLLNKAWEQVPEKLVSYDYIGCNPSKGGLFRSGPIIKGDGIVQNWLGHASFEIGTLSLTIRRMPAFFETFPVILIDQGGSVRADIPFRRAESRYSIEQTFVVLYFQGGILNGIEYSTPSFVKNYARKSQFGEIFTFDKKTGQIDGVFRTSPKCWYSFSHITLAFIFFFGHLWHAGRALFQDIWTGVNIISLYQVEYGRNEKLGENINNASTLI